MANTHHISFITAAAVFFTFAAQAQTIAVSADAAAFSAREVQQPLSLMQAYVPDAAIAQPQLRLLVDDAQGDAAPPPTASAPIAQVDDDIDGPAINALSTGRLAITISQSARTAR